ncbi:GIY-YIG nuclease family protein [Flaviaesturariibacter terrae]
MPFRKQPGWLHLKHKLRGVSYWVYILHSSTLNQYYVGHTADLEDRLLRHRNSGSKSTKKAHDWQLVYRQSFPTRSEAMQREQAIKSRKSRNYIESIIKGAG